MERFCSSSIMGREAYNRKGSSKVNKKTLKDIDVKGKKVFCRVDLNVPLENNVITDDTRIRAVLPTIQYLVDQGAKVILASHFGRPKGEVVEELRLTPVEKRLNELLYYHFVIIDKVFINE